MFPKRSAGHIFSIGVGVGVSKPNHTACWCSEKNVLMPGSYYSLVYCLGWFWGSLISRNLHLFLKGTSGMKMTHLSSVISFSLALLSLDILFSWCQWEFQDRKMEVPTIYKTYFWGLNFREYPHKIWPKIWYVYVPPSVGSWRSPIDLR